MSMLSRDRWTLNETFTYVTVATAVPTATHADLPDMRRKAISKILERLISGELESQAGRFIASSGSWSDETRDVLVPPEFWEKAEISWFGTRSCARRQVEYIVAPPGLLDPFITYEALEIRIASTDVRELWPVPTPPPSPPLTPVQDRAAVSDAVSNLPARRRGPPPSMKDMVKIQMRKLSRSELAAMKQEAMKATFGASRDTCCRARDEVLSEFADR